MKFDDLAVGKRKRQVESRPSEKSRHDETTRLSISSENKKYFFKKRILFMVYWRFIQYFNS